MPAQRAGAAAAVPRGRPHPEVGGALGQGGSGGGGIQRRGRVRREEAAVGGLDCSVTV